MTDDTVIVTTKHATSGRKYHTDRECANAPAEYREWDRETADAWGYECCRLCAAGQDWAITQSDERSRSLRDLLRDGAVDHIQGHPEDDA